MAEPSAPCDGPPAATSSGDVDMLHLPVRSGVSHLDLVSDDDSDDEGPGVPSADARPEAQGVFPADARQETQIETQGTWVCGPSEADPLPAPAPPAEAIRAGAPNSEVREVEGISMFQSPLFAAAEVEHGPPEPDPAATFDFPKAPAQRTPVVLSGVARPVEWVYPGRPADAVVLSIACSGDGLDAVETVEVEEDSSENKMALFRRSAMIEIGRDHPDPLCEPRAVRDTQPEPFSFEDDIRVPMELVTRGMLSSPQLESIGLASRRFRQRLPSGARCGFLLGDGTGCGKGRCIASLLLDQWNRGARRHLWVSATSDLWKDAQRDLHDIGSGMRLFSLHKVKQYGALDALKKNKEVARLGPDCDGVLYITYSMLVSMKGKDRLDPKNSRFGQIMSWLKFRNPLGEGLICFDEAHKAKNLDTGTQVARLVDDLQRASPNCPVVYASATGATEVQHMQYMSRLGLWGGDEGGGDDEAGALRCTFPDFNTFRFVVGSGGMAAMELVAIQLRALGAMSCRSLAYVGTLFQKEVAEMNDENTAQYNAAAELWSDMLKLLVRLECQFDWKSPHLKEKVKLRGLYWAYKQRFFKGLVVASKVRRAVELTREALARGEAVVLSLWTTNEAVASHQTREDDDEKEFFSGPELMVERMLETFFPGPGSGDALQPIAKEAKLLHGRLLALRLPLNPLDVIIDELGGPNAVAEMSGRSHRRCRDSETGEVCRMRRNVSGRGRKADAAEGVDSVNIEEQRAFQRGEKHVAIITEAASAGISLHSDRRECREGAAPPRPRRMIVLELPWAADKAVQQLGRVHRSNQMHPPAFVCLVSSLGGESRFVSAVARRLKQLGAMTRGDRNAAMGNDAFGFEGLDVMSSPHNVKALDKVFQEVNKNETELTTGPGWAGWDGGWREFSLHAARELGQQEVQLEYSWVKKSGAIKKFLNRLLGCTVRVQNGLFEALANHIMKLDEVDRKEGNLDEGVVSLNRSGRWGKVREVTEIGSEPLGEAALALHLRKLRLDRGLPWEAARLLLDGAEADPEGGQGFYMRQLANSNPEPLLVMRRQNHHGVPAYTVHFPNLAPSNHLEGYMCTKSRLKAARLSRAELYEEGAMERGWRSQHELSATQCSHRLRGHRCTAATERGEQCNFGVRCIEEFILTGPLLAHWDVLSRAPGVKTSLVRASVAGDRVLIGILIPAHSLRWIEETFKSLKPRAVPSRAPTRSSTIPDLSASSNSDSDADGELDVQGAPKGSDTDSSAPAKAPRWVPTPQGVVEVPDEDEEAPSKRRRRENAVAFGSEAHLQRLSAEAAAARAAGPLEVSSDEDGLIQQSRQLVRQARGAVEALKAPPGGATQDAPNAATAPDWLSDARRLAAKLAQESADLGKARHSSSAAPPAPTTAFSARLLAQQGAARNADKSSMPEKGAAATPEKGAEPRRTLGGGSALQDSSAGGRIAALKARIAEKAARGRPATAAPALAAEKAPEKVEEERVEVHAGDLSKPVDSTATLEQVDAMMRRYRWFS